MRLSHFCSVLVIYLSSWLKRVVFTNSVAESPSHAIFLSVCLSSVKVCQQPRFCREFRCLTPATVIMGKHSWLRNKIPFKEINRSKEEKWSINSYQENRRTVDILNAKRVLIPNAPITLGFDLFLVAWNWFTLVGLWNKFSRRRLLSVFLSGRIWFIWSRRKIRFWLFGNSSISTPSVT